MLQSMRSSAKDIFWILLIAFVGWLALDTSGVLGTAAGLGAIVGSQAARANSSAPSRSGCNAQRSSRNAETPPPPQSSSTTASEIAAISTP